MNISSWLIARSKAFSCLFYGRAVETACKSSIINLAWWIIKRWAVVVPRQVLSTSRSNSPVPPPLKYLSVLECLQLRWGNKFSLLMEPWIRKTGPSKNIFYNANFTNLIDTHSHRLTMTGKTSRCGICGLYFESRTLLKRHIDQVHRITNESIRVLND